MYYRLETVLVAVVMALCGCSRGSAPVAAVLGKTLTRCEVEARAANIAALFAHKSPKTDAEKIKAQFCEGYAKYWVEDVVLAAAAEKTGVVPSTNLIAQCQRNAFQNFRAKGDKSYENLMAIPGLDRELWERQVRSEALKPAMRDYWAHEFPTNFPDSYAEGVIKRILDQNAAFAVSNRLQWAKATNVWEKLKSGADFVKTARASTELNEEAEDDGEWAVVDAKFLSDEPKLLKWLKNAKPGEFSPPIAADNGVMIARLDRLEEEDGFAVSRIFFHLVNILPPAGKAEIVAAAQRRYVENLYAHKLAELVSAANPVYFNSKQTTGKKETK